MEARDLLRNGDPIAALAQLKEEVRKAPRDVRLRTFLFQLFAVFGQWDRALTQLVTASELDALALPMTQAYRAAIRCEMLRARVFEGRNTPTIFGDPPPWISLLLEANKRLAAGALDDASGLRDAAFEAAPTISGKVNDVPFEWIADADPRLGPVLEAMIDGKYYWVPFGRLQKLEIDPPEDLRDAIWMPAHFIWTNGGDAFGFVPTRYPGSESADPALALSRRTEWQERGDWFLGLGQRMLTTNEEDVALMDLRTLEFTHPPEELVDPPADAA